MSKNTKILLKRSTVAGKAPTADIMESGEAFVNLAKGTEQLYFKNAANEVIATKLGPLDKELDETSKNGVENQAIAKKYNELKKQLDLISSIYSIYGFARVNGDNSPAGTIFFGEDSNLENITSHVHMGLTTRSGRLYKRCANCRLDVAVDGTELKIDGTDGDVMLVTDSKLYFLKGTVAAPADLNLGDGVQLNIIAFGMSPFSIYGAQAKAFDPFALSPQYTVNCKIDGVDDVVCAHSIYNTAYAGTYYAPLDWFNETFKPNGLGYPNQESGLTQGIWDAQGKNADQKTNRPYMGGYYEFYEIFIALMFCELKSVSHQAPEVFGIGCTGSSMFADNEMIFADRSMLGYSGVMFVTADGTRTYSSLYDNPITNGSSSSYFTTAGLCGEPGYGFTEMLEPDRILNDIAKAGLISKIWDGKDPQHENSHVVFEYDEAGNMKVSAFPNEELQDGENMTPNHKYYQVRNVPNVKGMADGAMTAVINIYVKMTFKDGTTVNNDDHTGGYAVYKFSYPVYRGMCLQNHLLLPMQGCHYVVSNIGTATDHYVCEFECAENVDDIPAQQSSFPLYVGDVGTKLELERGLTKVVQIPKPDNKDTFYIWAKKADYNASLFCYTHGGGTISTGECAHLLLYNYCEKRQKIMMVVALDGSLTSTSPSARSLFSNVVADQVSNILSGSFSIPHLQL